ncbi:unnamed protein product [Choristocarpus tenellus]
MRKGDHKMLRHALSSSRTIHPFGFFLSLFLLLGRSTKRGVDDLIRWALVANKVTGEERLAEEAKKVLAADMMTSLRRLTDDLNDDEWMYDPPNLGDGGRWKNRR